MPLYEYACRECSRRFEALVFGREAPACPACGGRSLEKLLSTFAVGAGPSGGPSGGTPAAGGGGCGTCGDPRGPGACGIE